MTNPSGRRPGLDAAAAAAIVANQSAWVHSVAEVESWDAKRIHDATKLEVQRAGRFPPEWAKRLDEVIVLKAVQLLETRHSTDADFHDLQLLIGLVANDDFRDQLDAMSARFAARWRALADATVVAQKLRDFRQAAAAREHKTHLWDIVGAEVAAAGAGGVSWARLAEVIRAAEGPGSKSGISQMLTAMQGKGLLESIQRGRNKSFLPGPHLRSNSVAHRSTPAMASVQGVIGSLKKPASKPRPALNLAQGRLDQTRDPQQLKASNARRKAAGNWIKRSTA